MTYTTTASRSDLERIPIPKDLSGSLFRVTITPISEADAEKEAFLNLKGIAGKPLDLSAIREERLSAFIN